MARKRGGLAGIYDRNKGLIRTGAGLLAGAVGGPLAGAAVGAAMRGLDREGKRGIGFDVGQGIRGGVEGALAGKAGQMGAAKLLSPGAASSGGSSVLGRIGSGLKGAADWASKNPEIVKMAGQGVLSQLPSPEDEINRQQFDLTRQETERRRQQQEQVAMLLMPMYQQMMQRRQPGAMMPPGYGG